MNQQRRGGDQLCIRLRMSHPAGYVYSMISTLEFRPGQWTGELSHMLRPAFAVLLFRDEQFRQKSKVRVRAGTMLINEQLKFEEKALSHPFAVCSVPRQ